MRIVQIEVIETKIALKRPYKLSKRYGDVKFTHPTVVKVVTDSGLVGWGETDAQEGFTSEAPESVAVVLKSNIGPVILGEEATNVLKIREVMDFSMRGNIMAKSAIDMACYDLLGKAAGMPVYKILGGNLYDSLPIMSSIGGGSREEAVAAANEVKALGYYHSLMIKVGEILWTMRKWFLQSENLSDRIIH